MQTLVDLVRQQAEKRADQRVYTFLVDGEDREASLTYAELEQRSRAIAALLQASVKPGDRVVLLYAPGLDYVTAYFGCLFAGCIAVPAYPPEPARLHRTLPRLAAIVKDADAAAVLTSADLLAMATMIFDMAPDLRTPKWLATDDVIASAGTHAAAWKDPGAKRETVAFLQYTSGSTGAPKGVVLTHGNLLENLRMISETFCRVKPTKVISWLPLYHDMGLIGGMLTAAYEGGSAVLMSPLDFLQNPYRWLRAVSKHRATISGAPNFAYDLCSRKITPEQRATLDLSGWDCAFNGAEPVRAETLARFAETFASCGFQAKSLAPCYGLAESTLMVSARIGATVGSFSPEALQEGRVQPGGGREMVASGPPVTGSEVRIVDPESRIEVGPGRTGEIWVRGLHVAQGYWAKKELSDEVFGARLASGEGPFLRTGDLGFLEGGGLYVAGRAKDLVIIRGRNLYPNDIELTVEHANAAIRKGCTVAFSADIDGEERLVIVAEAQPPFVADDVSDAVRKAVAEEHGVNVHAVVFIKPRSLPKTSSGKLQRRGTRQAFLDGSLDEIGRTEYRALPSEDDAAQAEMTATELASLPEEQRVREVESHIRRRLSSVLGVALERVDPSTPFASLGLDSLMAVEMAEHMEMALEVSVPQAVLFRDDMTVAALAKHVAKALGARSGGVTSLEAVPLVRVDRGKPIPLSFVQRQMWEWEKKNPNTGAWNLPIAFRVKGPLRTELWWKAFDHVLAQNEVLRARLELVAGEPCMTFLEPAGVQRKVVDLRGGKEPVEQVIMKDAYVPYALVGEPLTRATLFRVADDEHVFYLRTHHVLFDNASTPIILGDFRKAYETLAAGVELAPVPETLQYGDFAAWQHELSRRDAWKADLEYWAKHLQGSSPVRLPYDRPEPATPTRQGVKHLGFLPLAGRTALENLARTESATMYAVIAAVLAAVLHRHGAGDDVLLGIVKSTRDASQKLAHMTGYFTNQLPLRVDTSGKPTLRQLLERTRAVTRNAYAHQEPPASVILSAPTPMDAPQLRVILNVLGAMPAGSAPWHDLTIEPMQIPTPPIVRAGEITIVMADLPMGTPFEVVGIADRFDEKTIAAIGADFEKALLRAGSAPDTSIDALCEG